MSSCNSPPEVIQGDNDNLVRGHKITTSDVIEFHKLWKVHMANAHVTTVPTILDIGVVKVDPLCRIFIVPH
jgi:hypothetical protein